MREKVSAPFFFLFKTYAIIYLNILYLHTQARSPILLQLLKKINRNNEPSSTKESLCGRGSNEIE
jgi:hypothetical protein